MGRFLGLRRIIATVLVMAATGAVLVVAAGSAGGQRPEPNCVVDSPLVPPREAIIIPDPREQACATLRVTKIVHGTAPAGTTFTVLVECTSTDPDVIRPPIDRAVAQQLPPGQIPPFTTVLTFPATGGTQDVFVAGLSSCTVSEAPPGPGCTLAGVTPATTQVTAPQVYPVFVTNNCTAPGPETVNIQSSIVVNNPAAATAVVAAPRFTG
jgi:hypothetical protein